ncbi:hypothetical protein ABIA35_003640 [Catenulispora sp. MAP12-49]
MVCLGALDSRAPCDRWIPHPIEGVCSGDPEHWRPQAAPPPNHTAPPRTKTKPNSRGPPPSGGPQGAPPAVERPPEAPAFLLRKSKGKGGNCEGQGQGQELTGASGGACAASGLAPGSGGRVVGRRLLLVVAFVPDSPPLRRPEGTIPAWAVSSRITRCCGCASSGWTPPSPGWLCKHRRSDGESGTTPTCGNGSGTPRQSCHRRVCEPSGPRPHHRRGLSRIPRRFGGRSQAGRAGGVKSLILGHQLGDPT